MPPALSAPLPEDWVEERDSSGRTLFRNHRTQTTTWEVSGQHNTAGLVVTDFRDQTDRRQIGNG